MASSKNKRCFLLLEFATGTRVAFGFCLAILLFVQVARWLLKDKTHSHQTMEKEMVDVCSLYPFPMGGYGTSFEAWLFHPGRLANANGGHHRLPRVGGL